MAALDREEDMLSCSEEAVDGLWIWLEKLG